jgi:predicted acyl esterase
MPRIALWIVGGLVLSVIVVGLVAAFIWPLPGDALTPAGLKRNTSYYIDMPDGVRIAAELWLPADLQPAQRIPAVIEGTRYWRAMGLTRLGRAAAVLGMELPGTQPTGYDAFFPANGYAMLTIDVRGTGASTGVHTIEYSLE